MMPDTFNELLRNSTSVIHFENGSQITAAQLAERGSGLAGALSGIIGPGARVAIWLSPGRSYLELLAACAAGGFVAVNVNTRYSLAEATDLIRRSGAQLVVTDQSIDLPTSVTVLAEAEVNALTAASTSYIASPQDGFLVFTTSGTTAKPKMVLHFQESIVRHSIAVARHFKLTSESPVLVALPMCGVFGLNSFAGAIAGNCPIWLAGDFDAEAVGSSVERHKIVAMNGSDDMFHRLLLTQYDLSTLAIAGFGAFNASLETVAKDAETRGAKLSGLYGMSEVQALFSFRDQTDPLPQRALAGGSLASPQAQVRVVDPESGAVLGHGVDGELELKGPSLFAGYLAEGGSEIDQELTSGTYNDGWFKTGDLGATNADGTFTFIARMGDVLRIGGFLVAPAEIEEEILKLDSVSDVQVVSVSSPSGSRPVAFVIKAGSYAVPNVVANNTTIEEQIIAHCRAHLAKFKCPVLVIDVEEFPTTDGPNGVKIQRAKLRELAQAKWETTKA